MIHPVATSTEGGGRRDLRANPKVEFIRKAHRAVVVVAAPTYSSPGQLQAGSERALIIDWHRAEQQQHGALAHSLAPSGLREWGLFAAPTDTHYQERRLSLINDAQFVTSRGRRLTAACSPAGTPRFTAVASPRGVAWQLLQAANTCSTCGAAATTSGERGEEVRCWRRN